MFMYFFLCEPLIQEKAQAKKAQAIKKKTPRISMMRFQGAQGAKYCLSVGGAG